MSNKKLKHGLIVFWNDYVRVEKHPRGRTEYLQSEEPRNGYTRRTLAMTCSRTEGNEMKFYLGATLLPQNKGQSKKTGRDMAYRRLAMLLENDGDVPSVLEANGMLMPKRGMTMVPEGYLELVLFDEACFSGIYGPPDESTFHDNVRRLTCPTPLTKTSSESSATESLASSSSPS